MRRRRQRSVLSDRRRALLLGVGLVDDAELVDASRDHAEHGREPAARQRRGGRVGAQRHVRGDVHADDDRVEAVQTVSRSHRLLLFVLQI